MQTATARYEIKETNKEAERGLTEIDDEVGKATTVIFEILVTPSEKQLSNGSKSTKEKNSGRRDEKLEVKIKKKSGGLDPYL